MIRTLLFILFVSNLSLAQEFELGLNKVMFEPIREIAFSNNKKMFVAHSGPTLTLYDYKSRKPLHEFAGIPGEIRKIKFSKNDEYIVVLTRGDINQNLHVISINERDSRDVGKTEDSFRGYDFDIHENDSVLTVYLTYDSYSVGDIKVDKALSLSDPLVRELYFPENVFEDPDNMVSSVMIMDEQLIFAYKSTLHFHALDTTAFWSPLDEVAQPLREPEHFDFKIFRAEKISDRLIGLFTGDDLMIYDVQDYKIIKKIPLEISTYEAVPQPIPELEFEISENGKYLVCDALVGVVIVDLESGNKKTLGGHYRPQLTISTDDTQVAVSNNDSVYTYKLSDGMKENAVKVFKDHHYINALHFTPNDHSFLIGSSDGSISQGGFNEIEITTGRTLKNMQPSLHSLSEARLDRDYIYAISNTGHAFRLSLTDNAIKRYIDTSHNYRANFFVVSDKNDRIVVSSYDSETRVYDLHSCELIQTIPRSEGSDFLRLTEDENYVVYAGGGRLGIYDLHSNKVVDKITEEERFYLMGATYRLKDNSKIIEFSTSRRRAIVDLNKLSIELMDIDYKDETSEEGFANEEYETEENWEEYDWENDPFTLLNKARDSIIMLREIYEVDGTIDSTNLKLDRQFKQDIHFSHSMSFYPNLGYNPNGYFEMPIDMYVFHHEIQERHRWETAMFSSEVRSIIAMEFTDDRLLVVFDDKEVALFKRNGDRINLHSHKEIAPGYSVESVHFSEDQEAIIVVTKSSEILIYDLEGKLKLLQVLPEHSKEGFQITYPYYRGPAAFVPNLFFRNDKRIYDYSQMDLFFNRPDSVLVRLGVTDRELIDYYSEAADKRIEKMGNFFPKLEDITKIPVIEVQNEADLPYYVSKPSITLALNGKDEQFPITHIQIWINKVPIYPGNGLMLKKPSQRILENVNIDLNYGDNEIEIACFNEKGVSSLREIIYVNNTATPEPHDLYFIGLGARKYKDESMNLSFADKDIRDVAQLLSKSDLYKTVHIDTLMNEDLSLANLKDIEKKLSRANYNDEVIIMYSGHGVLDDELNYYLSTYAIDFRQPEVHGIPYQAIQELIEKTPARKRLILIDACHSGEIDKDETSIAQNTVNAQVKSHAKGDLFRIIQSNGNSFALMKELFTDLRRGAGATVISSSSGQYYSYEDATHQNGIYTYALKEGLEGAADANNDQEISVSELKTYLYHRVSELTNGKQKPTTREENLEFDFRVY